MGSGPAGSSGISLLHGWLPTTLQVLTVVVLAVATARASRSWWLLRVPLAAVIGIALSATVRWYILSHGLTTNRVPMLLWIWIAVFGFAVVILVAGFGDASRRAKVAAGTAIPLSLVCVLVAVNMWVGYFPTAAVAWGQLTDGPLPDEVSTTQLAQRTAQHRTDGSGALLRIETPSATSGLRHREELVYLPPAWFAAAAPQLPVLLMIPAAFNTPQDWARAGAAVATVDAYAAAHAGRAPILVFGDVSGSFTTDSECVDGARGNTATHLIDEVVPAVASRFGTPARGWGVVGFSMGGTCAVHLAVGHPEVFRAFADIGGDATPNTGAPAETVRTLYGGRADAVARFDPLTLMRVHAPYTDMAGWFSAISDDPAPAATSGCAAGPQPDTQAKAAQMLCTAARAAGIDARVVISQGLHDWPTAAAIFAEALPWLMDTLTSPAPEH